MPAALMLSAVVVVLSGRDEVDEYTTITQFGDTHTLLARAALALRFSKMPKAFQLRALLEGWDLERIVREMY